MPGNYSQKKVRTKLSDATHAWQKPINEADDIEHFEGLPDAFPISKEHLPVVSRVLELLEEVVDSGEHAQEIEQEYGDIFAFGESCRAKAETLQDLFDAVGDAGASVESRIEKYRNEATQNDDDGPALRIEVILRDLLQQAVDLPLSLVMEETEVRRVEKALAALNKVDPSLKDDSKRSSKGKVIMNNNSSGNQFLHNGEGDMNHCAEGGFQINGRGNNIYHGSGGK